MKMVEKVEGPDELVSHLGRRNGNSHYRVEIIWVSMMDGDASHSSEIRSLMVGTEVGLVWFLFFFPLSFSLIRMFISIFRSVYFYIDCPFVC
jgi:hypothetical protein